MSTEESSPRPWRVEGNTIWDAEGGVVVSALNPCDRATRRLIVDAVNERDCLRDIVRNAVETLEQVYKHADMTDALREVVAEMQREARAAIGEEGRA